MLPNDSLPPERLAGRRLALDPRCVGVVGVAERLGDHRVAVVDRALDAGRDDGLAGEPLPVADPDVDGEDHGGRGRDGLVGERGGPGRALRLDLDRDAGPRGRGLEGLGGHVGVRDAGRARGDGDQRTRPARRGRTGGSGGGCLGRGSGHGGGGRRLVADDPGDQRDDLGGCRRGAEAVGELLLDQRTRQLRQQLEVRGVAAGGRGDQEGEVGGAVLRPELHAR